MTHTASSPDAACAGVAPIAVSPASTTANELVNPTSAATTPAPTACSGPASGGVAVVGAEAAVAVTAP